MAARITVTSDIDRVVGRLAMDTPRAVEIATQRALLATAREVKGAEVREMGRVFDRPTRWTLNSFQVRLDKAEMQARVEIEYCRQCRFLLRAAWLAQRALRHKSRKLAFRQLYWVTVLLHCTALVQTVPL